MKRGTTIHHPKNLTCPNCATKDFDKRVITSVHNHDTYAYVRYECLHCKYTYCSLPFRVIDPLNEEEEENEFTED